MFSPDARSSRTAKLAPRARAHFQVLLAVSLGLIALRPADGLAQPATPSAVVSAQARFEQAMADMDRGDYAAAARKLEDVTQLVPEGVGAKEALAECYEKLGRLASAWSQLSTASALARTQGADKRAEGIQKLADALRPRLATLTLGVPAAVRDVSGIQVMLNGVLIEQARWDTALPVDKGVQKIEVTAPGHKKAVLEVAVENDGATARAEVPPLEKESPEKVVDPWAGAGKPRTWLFPVGVSAAGVGLVGVGAGAVLGALAIGKNDASNKDGHCSEATDACDSIGLSARTEARTLGDASTVAFIAGGVVLATGVTLTLLAPRSTKSPDRPVQSRLLTRGSGGSVSLYFSGTNMGVCGSW